MLSGRKTGPEKKPVTKADSRSFSDATFFLEHIDKMIECESPLLTWLRGFTSLRTVLESTRASDTATLD